MSTLILRDVTLAICGAPESRGDRGEHLVQRIAEVQARQAEELEQCLDLLISSDGLGEEADLEILTALMIIGMACPEMCENKGFTGLAIARRVASRLEQAGDADAALAIIEQLRETFPGQQALERDYDAVLGRLGMVLNLADRYYDRAQQLLAKGELEEGSSWLREVLLLDPARTDVARQIRNLRLGENAPKSKTKRRRGLLALSLMLPLALAGVVMRESQLSDQYEDLPAAALGDLASHRERLTGLNRFARKNSIWHGSIFVERERTQLRLEVDRLDILDQARLKELAKAAAESLAKANGIRGEARRSVGLGLFEEALTLFEQAAEAAPVGWEYARRNAMDITVIREHLADLALARDSQ